jgi:seryl-tRNA(Sec) selenium transferase
VSHGGPGLGPRALFLLLAACSSATQQVVETRDLDEAGGAPRIDEVLDLGGGDVPSVGEVRPSGRGDGVAVVGEAL